MENANRWYFTKDELACTPSIKSGIDGNKELSYRQQAANFIQDMGQRLQVSQLCINTAIVYMHRFYYFHSFSEVHRNSTAVAALFLAAKVEEQPRKLEHVIKVAHLCLHKDFPPLDVRTEAYSDKQFEVVAHENVLLQTLGFVLAIEHPHTYVVKVCQLVKASKDLAQTSYFMATTSLHMTTMCLQYKPTVVACVCIHLACKWSSWKIEPCSEGKEWYYYVDKSVTLDLLETLTQEFIAILETSPHRFKRKFIAQKEAAGCHGGPRTAESDFRQHHTPENKTSLVKKEISSPGPSTSSSLSSFNLSQTEEKPTPLKIETVEKPPALLPPSIPQPIQPIQSPPRKNKIVPHSISLDSYREKKEKERQELKTVPTPVEHVQPQLPIMNKSQPALSDLDRIHKNPVEQHSHPSKDKPNKSSINKEHQVHSTSVNKINHHLPKVKSEGGHSKESKSNLLKMPSGVSDPVVVLERVDAKSEVHQDIIEPDVLCSAPHPVREKVANVPDHKYPTQGEKPCDSKETALTVTSSHVIVTKSKHPKHKTNSVHNSHNSAQSLPHKLSPIKDLKTNGSKETDPNERRNTIIENNVVNVKSESSKHEKREKHKSKHSSRDKSISNHSEHSNPAIKVKIRKDIINLPDKSQKPPLPVTPENPKKTLKIKLPKPPAPESGKGPTPTSIKLVITKDKSGSGSYSTSHKNDRESRKRAHSPPAQDSIYKNFSDTPSKHAKLDHSHSSHLSMKQSKVRHSSSRNADQSSNDVGKRSHLGNDYHTIDVETYDGNQYFPYQSTPPPAPRGKTNSNHPPLPPPLPPQPPPPPPE